MTGYAQATWECKVTSEQASADLLKSSWILDNVLLQHETSNTNIEEGTMKLIKDLMSVSNNRNSTELMSLCCTLPDLTSRTGSRV